MIEVWKFDSSVALRGAKDRDVLGRVAMTERPAGPDRTESGIQLIGTLELALQGGGFPQLIHQTRFKPGSRGRGSGGAADA